MRSQFITGLIGSMLSISVVFAQTTTTPPATATPTATTPAPAVTPTTGTAPNELSVPVPQTVEVALPAQPSLATPTNPVTGAELGVAEEPGLFTVLGLKLQRLFAFTAVKRVRITEQLARTLLQRARIAVALGDQAKAQQLLTAYNQETAKAAQLFTEVFAQVDFKANPSAQALATQIQEAKLLEAAVLDEIALKATGQFNKRVLKERAEVAKKLVKLLTKEDLTPEELERKIAKLTAKLAEKEAKAEEKFAKRIAVLSLLDEAAGDEPDEEQLDDVIEKETEDVVGEIAAQPTDRLGAIVAKIPGSTTKHLVVLQNLLDRVPEQARGTIEAVLTKELEKAKLRLERKQAELEDLVDDDSAELKEAKDKILTKLQEKADEKIIKAIEKASKKLQKAEEKRLKRLQKIQKKAVEQEDEDEDEEKKEGEQRTAAPTTQATPSVPTTGRATSTPAGTTSGAAGTQASQPQTHRVELENDGFSPTSRTIGVGDSVEFRVKDEGSYQILSGPHPTHTDIPELDSGTVSRDARYSFTFRRTGTFRFHDHLHPSFTGTITVR